MVFQDLEWSGLFLKDSMKYFVHHQDDLQKCKSWYCSWGLQWVHPSRTPFPDLGHKKFRQWKKKKKKVFFPTTDKNQGWKTWLYVCEPTGLKNPHNRMNQPHTGRIHAPVGVRGQAFSVRWVVLWGGCWVTLDKFTNKIKNSHLRTREVKVREDEENDFSLKSRIRKCSLIACIWAEFFCTLFVCLYHIQSAHSAASHIHSVSQQFLFLFVTIATSSNLFSCIFSLSVLTPSITWIQMFILPCSFDGATSW